MNKKAETEINKNNEITFVNSFKTGKKNINIYRKFNDEFTFEEKLFLIILDILIEKPTQ